MISSQGAFSLRNCRRLSRRQTGQGTVEGVLTLWLISIVLVFAVSLMLFVGNYLHCLLQIQYVAQQAAQYGINKRYYMGLSRHTKVATVEKEAAKAVLPLLKAHGLGSAKVTFTEVKDPGTGITYGQATVSVTSLSVLGGGVSILGLELPKMLNISQTALAQESDEIPPYIACIAITGSSSAAPTGGCLQVPCVGGGPWNGGNPQYFPYTLGVPGANSTDGPGYCFLTSDAPCTNTSAVRYPFHAGVGWGY